MRAESVSDVWRAEATLRVGLSVSGPFELPSDEPVTVGRAEHCGLRTANSAVSHELARLVPSPNGWILENGKRTRVRVVSVFVVDASFAPRAHVLLQPADWTLAWDLDVTTELTIRYRRPGHGEKRPVARDGEPCRADDGDQHRIGTDVAGEHLNLTALQRRRLGALFAYMIEGTPKPEQLIPAAAKRSGDSIPQITGAFVRVREYVNRHRELPIDSIEDLGYHLVEVSGVIGPDDLPDANE